MALSFQGLEPVDFGGKECTVRLNAEQKLRLQQLKYLDEGADEVLAGAFPDDYAYVLDFLRNGKMTDYDKQILRAYLVGGPHMLELIQEKALTDLRSDNG